MALFLKYESRFSEVKMPRHIRCEDCEYPVNGGFDPKVNQVSLSVHSLVHLEFLLTPQPLRCAETERPRNPRLSGREAFHFPCAGKRHDTSTFKCPLCARFQQLICETDSLQIVVCQNRTKSLGTVCGVVGHEMTHMFDYCRTRLDFKNLEHLACTEVGTQF